jgi:hypothetical protein
VPNQFSLASPLEIRQQFGMNCPFRAFALVTFLALTAAAPGLDFSAHPFFKHLSGDWQAEGELKGEDGNLLKITETWSGKADAEGSFYFEGTRTVNGDTQPFKWTMTHNAATDGYEAVMAGADGSQTLRFEGSFSEVDMVMNYKAITGAGESSITLQDSFAADTKDTLETKVTFTGDQGQTTLSGTITHKRVKTP